MRSLGWLHPAPSLCLREQLAARLSAFLRKSVLKHEGSRPSSPQCNACLPRTSSTGRFLAELASSVFPTDAKSHQLHNTRSVQDDRPLVMLDALQQRVAEMGSGAAQMVVALSGGPGSALLLWLAVSLYEDITVACIADAARLPVQQLERARCIADLLGVELLELSAEEASCSAVDRATALPAPHSERALYDALRGLAGACKGTTSEARTVVFCGANAADLAVPGRDGLRAAVQEGLAAPLADILPAAISAMVQYLGLPDWGHTEPSVPSALAVAAPCAPPWPLADAGPGLGLNTATGTQVPRILAGAAM